MNRILAALMFFTRLPFWRIKQVPAECFKHVVNYWSYAGWITGLMMAVTFLLASFVLPPMAAAVLALVVRLLVTGALHEDGLADFCDGFGGGTERSRILAIMKDSHIGSYGVIGLICYFVLITVLLAYLPPHLSFGIILTADTWSKFVSSNIVNLLPYARKEEESKAHTVYDRMHLSEFLFAFVGGVLAMCLFLPPLLWIAAIFPIVVFLSLISLMRKRLEGYTGDCCGATFLLCELSFYVGVHIVLSI